MQLNRIIEIDFEKCFLALVKNIKLIILFTILAALLGVLVAQTAMDDENEYEATSSVYGIVYGSFTDSADILSSLKAYGEVVKSYKIAERASLLIGDDSLDKKKIYNMISVEYDSSTLDYSAIIYIHARSTDKVTSINCANAVAEAFVLEIANLTGKDDIQILDVASSTKVSYNARKTKGKMIIIFTIAGFVCICGFIVIQQIFSTKMYSPKEATDYGRLEILGVIPEFDIDEDRRLAGVNRSLLDSASD